MVYIYECQNSYSRTALIGLYVDSNIQYSFRYSDVGFTSQLGCSNTDDGVTFYNLYQTLTITPGNRSFINNKLNYFSLTCLQVQLPVKECLQMQSVPAQQMPSEVHHAVDPLKTRLPSVL